MSHTREASTCTFTCRLTAEVIGATLMTSQPVSSTDLWDLANTRPIHSLMLSSHLFLSLPYLLPSFAVPCMVVWARSDGREMCPCHFSLCLIMMVRMSLCGPIAGWILAQTTSLVTWSLYEMCSILQ